MRMQGILSTALGLSLFLGLGAATSWADETATEAGVAEKVEVKAGDDVRDERPRRGEGRERRGDGDRGSRTPGEGIWPRLLEADKDGDGKISREEAKAHLPGFSDERFDRLDRNNDGYLTPDEFPRRQGERPGGRERSEDMEQRRGGGGGAEAGGRRGDRERPEGAERRRGGGERPEGAARRGDRERPEGAARGGGRERPEGAEGRGRGPGGPGGSPGEWINRLRAADTNGDGKLSLEEWRAAMGTDRDERFHQMDRDNTGEVSIAEIANRMRQRQRSSTPPSAEDRRAYLERMILQLDMNGDGKLSWDEVQAGRPGMPRDAFDRLDRNNDGVLSLEDAPPAR